MNWLRRAKINNIWIKAEENTKELEMGIEVEKEHSGTIQKIKDNPELTVDEICTLIAEDHLKEMPDYYTQLKKMEANK